MYIEAARIYDVIYEEIGKDYAAESREIIDLIDQRHPDARDLLDVACGTGSHLLYFSEQFDAAGLDLSPAMLEVARHRVPEVHFEEADMRTFDLDRTFDVVVCLFSAIGYMTTRHDLDMAIANMAGHLEPDGLLIVEAWFAPEAWEEGRVDHKVIDRDDLTIVRMSSSSRQDDISVLDMHYLVGRPEGVEHFSETHRMGLFRSGDYEAAFAMAGLVEHEMVEGVGTGRGHHLGRRRPTR